MILKDQHKKKITAIWDKYIADNKKVHDTKGNDLGDIDNDRRGASVVLNEYISDYLKSKIDIGTFKTNVDSFNKQNNLWGFTSIKGQMFFNLLLKTCHTEDDEKKLSLLLKKSIKIPENLKEATNKIETLYQHCKGLYDSAPDKRKVPNPSSITYFLSYFWQIQDANKWPIMFSSMIVSFTDIGIWTNEPTPMADFEKFYNLNEEIKSLLSVHTNREISNWDAEHSFWNFRTVSGSSKKAKEQKLKTDTQLAKEETEIIYKASFDIFDYVIPAVARLIELGQATVRSASAKGAEFERAVSDVFDQLGFEVEYLGQGSGRNPDAVIRYRREHTAFLVDAKAYSDGYSPGRDDRAFRDYIRDWCPKLKDEGINKIGFIIVSNSFNSTLDTVINDLTWNTDIKRFILFETEALLHLIAFKNRHKLELSQIISQLVGLGNVITTQDIIQQFDDV
jgi:hypothetical protein